MCQVLYWVCWAMLYNLCQSLCQATSQASLQILRLHSDLLTTNRHTLVINARIKLGFLRSIDSGPKQWIQHYSSYFIIANLIGQLIEESYSDLTLL